MNNTSPGSNGPVSSQANDDLSKSLSNVNIGKSRTESKMTENEQPPPRLKLTPNDFEWGETIGEGSYSRVRRLFNFA
jgi:hypothetical protein